MSRSNGLHSTKAVAAALLALAKERSPKSICPSDVARRLEPENFRALMDDVRKAAATLARRGEVVVTQRGRVVDIAVARGPVRITFLRDRASYADAYRDVDFRKHPNRYRVGRGEEGVLVAEPYKSELLPSWRFRTPEVARRSARALEKAFETYRDEGDFVGMDMARKFIQMGFTRARRYARHAGGRKYGVDGHELPEVVDDVKNAAAAIFRAAWQRVEADPIYAARKAEARARERMVKRRL